MIETLLRTLGAGRIPAYFFVRQFRNKCLMRFPTFPSELHDSIAGVNDYFRYATIGLAVQRVVSDRVAGALAEAGVFRGDMSKFIHAIAPDRPFFLFDTFEGFPAQDIIPGRTDERFRNTNIRDVLRNIGDSRNLVVRKGYVPESFRGLEETRFSFVLLDLDLYKPTLASLEFFYSRLSRGGYCVVHDYNNAESEWACKRAVDDFLKDKPEQAIELSDFWGTVLFRKS